MRHRRTWIALCIATLGVLMASAACGGDSGGEPTAPPGAPTVAAAESPTAASCDSAGVPAAATDGEQRTVEGAVVGTSVSEDERGRSIILELRAAGGAPFAVAIPENAIANFTEPPQEMYEDAMICVRGTVIDHRGVPTIFVTTPAEIAEREPIDP